MGFPLSLLTTRTTNKCALHCAKWCVCVFNVYAYIYICMHMYVMYM